MKRREFITLAGGAIVAWPLVAGAQQAGKIPRIGWIILGSPAGSDADVFSYYDSFRAGLGDGLRAPWLPVDLLLVAPGRLSRLFRLWRRAPLQFVF